MSFKEEPQKEKLTLPFIFWGNFFSHLNRVDIQVIKMKVFNLSFDSPQEGG